MFIDRIVKILKLHKAKEALVQMQEEIRTWYFVNGCPEAGIKSIFDAIRKDKSLLEYYFQDIDWKKVDVDLVYEMLFNEATQRPRAKK